MLEVSVYIESVQLHRKRPSMYKKRGGAYHVRDRRHEGYDVRDEKGHEEKAERGRSRGPEECPEHERQR